MRIGIPPKRFCQSGCLIALVWVLFGTPSLRVFASQEQGKAEKSAKQLESKKQVKRERKAEAANALPAVLWRDPGDVASRDLLNGEGGTKDAPDAHADYFFVNEDMNGTSTKFYVRDSNGVKWLVKLGVEAKPETAAARLVWAMGYFTDEDYFLPEIHVRGLPKLRRRMFGASPETGSAPNVRLKRQGDDLKKVENWAWFDNPFVGTREFNGLRVLMAVINNWDLTTENNKVYVVDNERHYVVSDLGATFGKTGWPPSHVPLLPHATKGVLKDYEQSKLIRAMTGDTVTFEMHTTAPFFMKPFDRKYFNEYRQAEHLERGIPVSDVRWMGSLLTRLTPQQMRDAFRAAGYQPEAVEGYAKTVENRIAALSHVNE